jgi:hypothetical protein
MCSTTGVGRDERDRVASDERCRAVPGYLVPIDGSHDVVVEDELRGLRR